KRPQIRVPQTPGLTRTTAASSLSPDVSWTHEGGKCLEVDVRSLLWISVRTQRRESLPLKPLCVGTMRARPKVRGQSRTPEDTMLDLDLDLDPAVCPSKVTGLKTD
ncbi:uncharacterized protein KZ484_000878, partial [Pholidichthys leucotaenia]